MYKCNLFVYTISDNTAFPEMSQKVPVPEDCSITFISQSDCENINESCDSVVIFDGIDIFRRNQGYLGDEQSFIVIITPAQANCINEIKSGAKDIWMIPDECRSEFIAFYMEKLIIDMKRTHDYRLQSICMTTAFDSIPDLVWFKDTNGAHLIVNQGFCDAVDKTKEQIFKKGHYYIWDIPKEEYDKGDYVCLESEEIVIQKRETCIFNEKVKTKRGMRQFLTYKSPLIDVDGHIFGTCGVANDVTTQHNINSELEVVLNSMPFVILLEDEYGNVIAKNERFDDFFPEYTAIVGQNSSEWKQKILKGKENKNEIIITVDGEEYFLIVTERPIFSIFHEKIGNAIIMTDVTQQTKTRKQNILCANTDFLTGLYNRRMLFSFLDAHRKNPYMAMITIDLDNFKAVNDTYGHHAGDRALVDTASLLREYFKGDFVARLGGDEFLVVITKNYTEEQVLSRTHNFLEALQKYFDNTEEFSVMTASAGVASYTIDLETENEHDFENLMKCSDNALYQAKNTGKNTCCVYKWHF